MLVCESVDANLPRCGIIIAMYARGLGVKVTTALSDTPVVLVNGARQSGKTTLVRALAAGRPGAVYRTFDDAATLAAAVADPVGFARQPAELLIVDEVQQVPKTAPSPPGARPTRSPMAAATPTAWSSLPLGGIGGTL